VVDEGVFVGGNVDIGRIDGADGDCVGATDVGATDGSLVGSVGAGVGAEVGAVEGATGAAL